MTGYLMSALARPLNGDDPAKPQDPKSRSSAILAALGVTPSPPDIPSGYLDTLSQLTGRPNAVMRTPSLLGKLLQTQGGFGPSAGNYFPSIDAVTVDRNQAADRTLLAHEFGHHYANTHQTSPYMQAMNAAPAAPREWAGAPNYAAVNRHEQQGTAFENAQQLIDFASRIANSSPDPEHIQRYFASNLRDGERMAPGTTAMLSMMVNNPIYAKHPIQQFRGIIPTPPPVAPTIAPVDATAVRR